MPSTKNPASTVFPGPGKLSSGVATASAFIFSGGGGGGSSAALHAHIIDPMDAHMSGAIGIPATDPVTGLPILASAGGPVDGESVYDFIVAAKDLFPIRPNVLGYALPGVPNSGVPDWDLIAEQMLDPTGTAITGGYTRGAIVQPTHFLMPGTGSTSTLSGTLYPADRGILAVYYNTDGDFLNPAATTLVGALWLSSSAVPAGVPTANFDEALRAVDQVDHTAPGVGLDTVNLTHRLPYLKSYTPYGSYYTNYDSNFYRYQLAHFSYNIASIPDRDAGSWLVVHWRETYALTLLLIQPLAMSTHLTAAYCYSAVPTAANFDVNEIRSLNRHNVYRDIDYATPSPNSYTNTVVGSPSTVWLSGVQFYSNGATPLRWDMDIQVVDLLSDCYYTGTSTSGAVPAGFTSIMNPMMIDFTDFGGGLLELPYNDLRDNTTLVRYDLTHPPGSGDINRFQESSVSIFGPTTYASPVGGWALLHGYWYKPFVPAVPWSDTPRYLFNSYPQTGGTTASTAVYEPFTDERYRYVFGTPMAASLRVEPIPANLFDGTGWFSPGDVDAQVIGHQLVYPHTNFTSGYLPSGPDYAAVLAGDPASHLRGYLRAFNTGVPRNTGKLRIRGLSYADIASATASPTDVRDGHTGGLIVLLKVPGQTGWLDLGRAYGVPDLNMTADYRGCQTGVDPNTTATDFTVTFNTGAYTANNGSGEFPLFIMVYFVKNGVGHTQVIDDITWEAP
jgi:hypothetical protein